ncbi:hypothetical protein P148_SR1C00001G0900 [candidate division SR1 bacterium RAAC1_SR1_1]|nr:hypothetical protein P148_SR1C00001G0900 [candidate division SR1 bacterium RAAC1_SR1_1]
MVVGLFFLRGQDIVNQQSFVIIKEILMPGYLIFCGIMLGYILARINIGYNEQHDDETKIYTKYFLIGTSVGLILAVIYIVL